MDSPKELENLVEFLAVRIVGPEEAWPLTEETLAWIGGNLDRDYSWPGNVRELEQCVRNILIRGSYSPPPPEKEAKGDPLMQALNGCALTADELLSLYCSIVFDKTGKYSECAKILDIDRRTVKSKVLSIKSGL
jgi:DNA-binding NtrC family response regulator